MPPSASTHRRRRRSRLWAEPTIASRRLTCSDTTAAETRSRRRSPRPRGLPPPRRGRHPQAPRSGRAGRSHGHPGRRVPAAAREPAPARRRRASARAQALDGSSRRRARSTARVERLRPRRRHGRRAGSHTGVAEARGSPARRSRPAARNRIRTRAAQAQLEQRLLDRAHLGDRSEHPSGHVGGPAPARAAVEHRHSKAPLRWPATRSRVRYAGANDGDIDCLGIVRRRPQRKSPYRHYPARS